MKHNQLKYLKDGWQKTLHIVSAGPSLRGFDFKELKSEAVMTLNNTIFHLPSYIKPKYHVYCEPVDKELKNYIKMSSIPHVQRFSIYDVPNWVHVPPFSGIENFAFQVAIMVGVYMGYKEINLYGYDFSFQNNYMYWWDKKPRNPKDLEKKLFILDRQKDIFRQFIENFDRNTKISMMPDTDV